ncbi:hypothetical protein SAMN05421812_10844 [Asanoa hainanensis]|uniref:Uncharacterized protein n=1 Tax=Asanoa hainanensis TaxID=560556 RepID=A0A239NBM2_9ACTN|nr:hypothetical protein SAMN05421812_10844 [Asanoa hainanensis]
MVPPVLGGVTAFAVAVWWRAQKEHADTSGCTPRECVGDALLWLSVGVPLLFALLWVLLAVVARQPVWLPPLVIVGGAFGTFYVAGLATLAFGVGTGPVLAGLSGAVAWAVAAAVTSRTVPWPVRAGLVALVLLALVFVGV